MTINTQKLALQALAGHGHVKPRPDGVRARCGGPAICRVCQQEKAQLEMSQRMDQAFHPLDGQHINQGSVDAAADAYEREYLRDLMDKALGRAYSMGQTYWMQADSESHSQNRRSDETQAKFDVMRAETMAKLCAALGHIDAQAAEIAGARQTIERWKERCRAARQESGALKRDITDYIRIGNSNGAEIARLRYALRWTAAALQEACRRPTIIDVKDRWRIDRETRTTGEILAAADVALAQEGS